MKVAALALFLLAPGVAQAQDAASGRVARSSAGQVGERLSRTQGPAALPPVAATGGRIESRVESRVRNRIDRFYDPRANATSPFAVAGDRARTATRPRRR